MKKLTDLEKKRLIKKAHALIDRLEYNFNTIIKEMNKDNKKAA